MLREVSVQIASSCPRAESFSANSHGRGFSATGSGNVATPTGSASPAVLDSDPDLESRSREVGLRGGLRGGVVVAFFLKCRELPFFAVRGGFDSTFTMFGVLGRERGRVALGLVCW